MNGNLQKFERGTFDHLTYNDFKRTIPEKMDEQQIRDLYHDFRKEEVWINNEYQVNIRKDIPAFDDQIILWHLSIKRLDKEPLHDWRDLQQIKNMLVGVDYEAVELYPSESRKVDSANQYHLWVFYKEMSSTEIPVLPFGWTTRYVKEHDIASGAKQRNF